MEYDMLDYNNGPLWNAQVECFFMVSLSKN